MAFVLKNLRGEYLKGRTAWTMEMTNDLQKARVYLRRGDATNTINNGPRYHRGPSPSEKWGPFKIVEVKIVEADEVAATVPMPPYRSIGGY